MTLNEITKRVFENGEFEPVRIHLTKNQLNLLLIDVKRRGYPLPSDANFNWDRVKLYGARVVAMESEDVPGPHIVFKRRG